MEFAATNNYDQRLCQVFNLDLKLPFNQAFTEDGSELPLSPQKLRPYSAIEIRLLLSLLL